MNEYITVHIAGARYALPVLRVGTVFRMDHVTRIPRAPPQLVGLFNLRGKIVPIVSLQRHVDPYARIEPAGAHAIGIEHDGEAYGLMIDTVGDVVSMADEAHIGAPRHGDPVLLRLTESVLQTQQGLLPILNIAALVGAPAAIAA